MSLALGQPCSVSACSSAGQVWQRRPCLTPVGSSQAEQQPCSRHVPGTSGWASMRQKVAVRVTHRDHEMWLLRYGWSKAEVGCWTSALVAACIVLANSFSSHFLRVQEQQPTWLSKFWSGLLLNHEILSGKRLNTTFGLISEATSKKANCTDLGDSVGNLITYSLRSALTSATCVPWVMKQPSWETNFWSPPTNPSFQSPILPSGDMTLPNPHGRHGIALYTV